MNDDEARYRIQAVAKMTGVPAATLRAWERRYGIPKPRRTQSSYRLYTLADVELVRQMRELCDEGLSASEAATSLARRGVDRQPDQVTSASDGYTLLAQSMVAAVRRLDGEGLEALARYAAASGPYFEVFERVLRPAMFEIGELWHAGDISPAQEHLGSEIIGTLSSDLLRVVQPPASKRLVVLGCFADEMHVLPLYGAAFAFARAGYRTMMLGARLPPESLYAAVQLSSPDAIGLSLTYVSDLERTRALLPEYAAAARGVPWIVGGRGASQIADLVLKLRGRVALGHELDVERLLR